MLQSMKRKFPWRIGATSYVTPADLMSNVQLLAEKVDDVQLLFFESAANSRLEHGLDINELQRIALEHDLTYTVHLPTDLRLGCSDSSIRRQAVDEVVNLVGILEGLSPLCYDLHLSREDMPEARWLEFLDGSLALLAKRLGDATGKVAVENLEYRLDVVLSLLRAYGFSVCLDIGHLVHYRHNWRQSLAAYLPHAVHIHYHGVDNGKDHCAITMGKESVVTFVGKMLAQGDYSGVVTLELYDIDQLSASLVTLERLWTTYETGRKNDSG